MNLNFNMLHACFMEYLAASKGQETAVGFDSTLKSLMTDSQITKIAVHFALVATKIGHDRFLPTAPMIAALEKSGFWPGIARYTLSELGRLLMLHNIEQIALPTGYPLFLRELYERGDLKEQEAILKSLAFAANPAQLNSFAAYAMRTNAASIFAALALDNSYPYLYMDDSSFNQLVLKALFLDMDTARIIGLGKRLTAELLRMVADYRRELEIAHRCVKPGIITIEHMA